MAIYHLSVKTVSRSAGRSATAAAAYRAGVVITDERTGEIHDYRRKGGIVSTELFVPAGAPAWAGDRASLWNAAEQAEVRKNSTVAREFEIALPAELGADEQRRLAHDFAREIVDRHGCAADVAIHKPNREGDKRNHHAHILITTRRLAGDGFAEKTRELDDKKTGSDLVIEWRERFATLQNQRLAAAGVAARVDHRTLEAQGIDREATRHLGPTATSFERRTGEPSRKRLDYQDEIAARLTAAKELGELERQRQRVEQSLLDLSGDVVAAKAVREQRDDPIARRRRMEELDEKIRTIEEGEPEAPQSIVDIHADLVKAAREREDKRAIEKKTIPPSEYATRLEARQTALARHLLKEPTGFVASLTGKRQEWEDKRATLEDSAIRLQEAIVKRDERWEHQAESLLQKATEKHARREAEYKAELEQGEVRRRELRKLEKERTELVNIERAELLRRAAKTLQLKEEGKPHRAAADAEKIASLANATHKQDAIDWLEKSANEDPGKALQELANNYVGTIAGADQRAQLFINAIGNARGALDARGLVEAATSAQKEREELQQQLRSGPSPKTKAPSGPGFT